MAKYRYTIFLCIYFICTFLSYSQSIDGRILDARTHQPLETVTIYYDGTTIGTATNNKGEFSLSSKVTTQAIIVVSYLGYETQYFSQENLKKAEIIYLTEKAEALDAVYIEDDNWSREKKMMFFKTEFLGRELASNDCEILNESAIKLIYIPSKSLLLASSDVPIQIKNDYLGYQVDYTIGDFQIQFKANSNGWVFYKGTSSFSELNPKTKRKHRKARESAFKGSVIQFMRALSKKQLSEQKFEIFVYNAVEGSKRPLAVGPYQFLKVIEDDNGFHKFEMILDKLLVLYDGQVQSSLILVDKHRNFSIDNYGIHSPADKLYFGGDFGFKRISTMLPLDFELDEN